MSLDDGYEQTSEKIRYHTSDNSRFSDSVWGRVADGPISKLVEIYAACNLYYDFKSLKGLRRPTEKRLRELSKIFDYSFIETSKWTIEKDRCVIRALRPSQGDFVLDIGCGVGLRTLKFAERGATVVGFDVSREAIRVVKRLANYFEMDNIYLIVGDVANMGFLREDKFNKVFCGDVVEHLSKRQKIKLFEGVERTLSEGGLMVITTPNLLSATILTVMRKPFILSELMKGGRGDLASTLYKFIKRENPEHIGLASIFELKHLLKVNRFMINKIEFYGYWENHLKNAMFSAFEKAPLLRQFLGRRIQITCTKR